MKVPFVHSVLIYKEKKSLDYFEAGTSRAGSDELAVIIPP